ncbi:methyltransferase domain-containing protein [Mongoliitalea daihaiensis]|uniref:methyltransferase domain-containing protein n=1 Tax=Mongoliitalea daihaiensis TaxID=2782006 RepID=UPI001F3AE747|nr:methyltransferase domain-containing protein [Mongoliitalea daihaiensis]UJP64173.1 methyltransferase domain-containing protein [Mongoliitalea daihaiensis]
MAQDKYIHQETVHNTIAAEIIVPKIMNLLKPKSVLDVGCGIGTWLNVFSKQGVKEFLGLDGDYVDKELLYKYINPSQFKSIDLEKPFNLKKEFDLVISLEVAEHLKESSADIFIESISKHSNNIIFSAAIPWQGGQNHLNEQWPNYWEAKFKKFGFKIFDLIRPEIWNNEKIEFWYKQNIFLFSKNNFSEVSNPCLPLIHPDLYKIKNNEIEKLKNELKKIREGVITYSELLKILKRKLSK